MQKPINLPRKPLALPEVEGYVLLTCMQCKDQFYVPKKKNELQDDMARWYVQFRFCASCAQLPKKINVAHPKMNTNWKPGDWNPANHDSGLLKQ